MADIRDLKGIFDAYGVGVRAGVITPQTADEAKMRELMGMPEMSEQVKEDWKESGGFRRPITLAVSESGEALTGQDD
jgi:hypothetical protein